MLRAVRVFRRVDERACPIRVSSWVSFPDLFSDVFARFTHVEECARGVSHTNEVVQIRRLNSVFTQPFQVRVVLFQRHPARNRDSGVRVRCFQVSASAAGQQGRGEDRDEEESHVGMLAQA